MLSVGLIGRASQREIERLAMRLEERGVPSVVLDGSDDPRITLDADGGGSVCGVDIRTLRSVYVADLRLPRAIATTPAGKIDAERSAAARARSTRVLAAWNALLGRLARRIPVVNPPEAHDLHALKAYETAVYAREDVPVPWTVTTTDPEALLALGSSPSERRFVSKGLVGGYGYTEVFTPPASAVDAARAVAAGPRQVQELVEGDNARAFVLDGAVVGAALFVSTAGGEVDSRRGETRVRRVELPRDVAATAVRVAQRWGMPFAAVDFMHEAATGRWIVLECNSAPHFVNFEITTGIDVSGKLANHLARERRREAAPLGRLPGADTP